MQPETRSPGDAWSMKRACIVAARSSCGQCSYVSQRCKQHGCDMPANERIYTDSLDLPGFLAPDRSARQVRLTKISCLHLLLSPGLRAPCAIGAIFETRRGCKNEIQGSTTHGSATHGSRHTSGGAWSKPCEKYRLGEQRKPRLYSSEIVQALIGFRNAQRRSCPTEERRPYQSKQLECGHRTTNSPGSAHV